MKIKIKKIYNYSNKINRKPNLKIIKNKLIKFKIINNFFKINKINNNL